MPEQQIKAQLAVYEASHEAMDVVILEENQDAFSAFLCLDTDWKFAEMAGVRIGLPAPAIQSVITMLGLSDDQQSVFLKIKTMERAALKVFSADYQRRRDSRGQNQ